MIFVLVEVVKNTKHVVVKKNKIPNEERNNLKVALLILVQGQRVWASARVNGGNVEGCFSDDPKKGHFKLLPNTMTPNEIVDSFEKAYKLAAVYDVAGR